MLSRSAGMQPAVRNRCRTWCARAGFEPHTGPWMDRSARHCKLSLLSDRAVWRALHSRTVVPSNRYPWSVCPYVWSDTSKEHQSESTQPAQQSGRESPCAKPGPHQGRLQEDGGDGARHILRDARQLCVESHRECKSALFWHGCGSLSAAPTETSRPCAYGVHASRQHNEVDCAQSYVAKGGLTPARYRMPGAGLLTAAGIRAYSHSDRSEFLK